jgi:DNA-binding NarL/FixJ family response regulator
MQELGAVIRNLLERAQMMQAELRFSSSEVTAPRQVLTPDSEATQQVQTSYSKPSAPRSQGFDLTEREQQVLDLLTTGLSNVEIGNKLHLSHRTVEKHVSKLLSKTATNNRAELVRFALENHLVE